MALGGIAVACAFTIWTNIAGGLPTDQRVAAESKTAPAPVAGREAFAEAYARLSEALSASIRRSRAGSLYDALFDSGYLGFPAEMFAKGAPIEADDAPVTASTRATARAKVVASKIRLPQAPAASLSDGADAIRAARASTFFEKLFGRPSSLTLAYAAPNDGLGDLGMTSGGYDRFTAVYDISAHTVYLPDGTALEAHSGFGPWMDDPHHTDIRMRGATPATLYDLKPRESLFHGVQALRLIPVDEAKVFGRTGLLAHTFMLGTNGQSNGCVSFRNYAAFLRAYLSGEVRRLAVVERID